MPNNIDLLYDHYKDSFSQIKDAEKKREYLFLFSLCFSVIVALQIGEPNLVLNISQEFVKTKLGEGAKINLNTIFSGIQFVWLWVLMMYYQKNVSIERQYDYLHTIEEQLSKSSSLIIQREGKSYLNKYPWFLWIVYRVYTVVFPLSIISVALMKWRHELYILDQNNKGYFIFDSVALFLTALITVLYMAWIHFRDFRKEKKH